jgi:1,4-dihydroxy-2-naphthoate octaprenyltransferase
MESLRPWFDAGRPGRALLAPLSVAVGSSYAHFDAQPGPGLPAHLIVTIAAFAAGLGVNFIDNGWDRLGAPPPDARSGPVPADPPLEARESFIAGIAAIALAAVGGLGLVPLCGSATLGYGFVAVAIGVLRRAPVFGLDTLGWGLGELGTLAALGPLAVLAGFASQAGSGSWGALLAGLPAGAIAAAVLFARHFTAADADARWARMTPLVALGEQQARLALVAATALAAAAVVIATRAGEYGAWANAAAAPLAVAAAAGFRIPAGEGPDSYERWERVALVCGQTALVCIVAALRIASPD